MNWTNWEIRRMSAGDIDAVLALAQAISEVPRWGREEYDRCIGADEPVPLRRSGFIAEAEGRFLGFSIAKLVAGVGELESIAVRSEARGKGTGGALLEATVNWARDNGATRIELEVRASNAAAIKLYEQAGLRREGLRRGYYQSPDEDAVLMGKALGHGGKPR